MSRFLWMIERLKAMSLPEVFWRFSQKIKQKYEELAFGRKHIPVTGEVFNHKYRNLSFYPQKLYINFKNTNYSLNAEIALLAGADYQFYKRQWNAGFQTAFSWPNLFSSKLNYKQRDEIGDARTNWELNRHFQFALLAKDYAISGDKKYYCEFVDLFYDWNKSNPFLCGISWTSVMEIAIRCSNWCYSYAFLSHSDANQSLLNDIRIGIINMTDYILKHYSRYSSANNHLIIEAYVIGQSGILLENKKWVELSIKILTEELSKQNYSDGINKEQSLHYQSFYMEAMGLMMRLLLKNGLAIPQKWCSMLKKMSHYLADCIGDYGEVVAFGDDDEGKILDLQGGKINYYQYVLGIMSMLLAEKYTDSFENETIWWLFNAEEIEVCVNTKKYVAPQYCCYKEGGNTILRSQDRKILIGIDHAALGFGSIAAHGHSDALSFQLFYEGEPVFIDPGTYIYHCDINSRNQFRRTQNHNTVCICDKDQSEMLGPFLWGRKANTELVCYEEDEVVKLVIRQDGYAPVIHTRTILFDGKRLLKIEDDLSVVSDAKAVFILGEGFELIGAKGKEMICGNNCKISIYTNNSDSIQCCDYYFSPKYGVKYKTKGFTISFSKHNEIVIKLPQKEIE